jgi:hypothetical protein
VPVPPVESTGPVVATRVAVVAEETVSGVVGAYIASSNVEGAG